MTWMLYTHMPKARPAPWSRQNSRSNSSSSPSGKTLTCGLYRTPAGLEVRADYGGDDLIRSQFVIDLGIAGEVAAAWKMTALAKAGFLELEA